MHQDGLARPTIDGLRAEIEKFKEQHLGKLPERIELSDSVLAHLLREAISLGMSSEYWPATTPDVRQAGVEGFLFGVPVVKSPDVLEGGYRIVRARL